MQRLPLADIADRLNLVLRLQLALDVMFLAIYLVSQDRPVCLGLKAISGRHLLSGLTDPSQADAVHGRTRIPIPAVRCYADGRRLFRRWLSHTWLREQSAVCGGILGER